MAKVKLGEIATEYKKTYKGNKVGIPIVGLEHLTPGEVKLSAWDRDSDNTFTKVFHKGQILFGRRRAYLKKAAVAPFDGICSGDITVIEAIPQKILPELLPFYIQNDLFFDFAVGGSAGSLSPRVKWEHLREYEINLPSIKKQRELAEVLWAAYELKESYKKLIVATDEMLKSQFIEMFGTLENPKNSRVITVKEAVDEGLIAKPLDGNHGGKHPKASEYVDAGIPFIMANNFNDEGIDLENCYFITNKRALKLDKGFAHDGDVLLTHKGTVGKTAILRCPEYEFIMLTPQVTYYRPLKGLISEYLKSFFDSTVFQEELNLIASSGSTRAYIGITEQQKLKLLIPDIANQQKLVSVVQQADKSKLELQKSINKIDNVIKSLIRQ